jgi:CDP-diacylglycerol---serine O-phosphatidyltransferase
MTAGNMICGFVAILYIVGKFAQDVGNLRYDYAIGLILLACLFDVLDGLLARISGQDSEFGREFDSLADIVSFGIAPALLVHDIVLEEFSMGGLGWIIACLYLVFGAVRLARFNCLSAKAVTGETRGFRGCPIPAAAGVIASLTLFLIWMDGEKGGIGHWKYVLPVLMVLLSFLMVSNIEYPSFKGINLRTKRSFQWVLIVIFVLVFSVRNWQWMPMVWFVSYLAYGLIRPWVSRKWQQEIEAENENEDSSLDADAPETNLGDSTRPPVSDAKHPYENGDERSLEPIRRIPTK